MQHEGPAHPVVPTPVFHDLFAGPSGIRVWIDWDRVLREEFRVTARFVTSLSAFSGAYLPWYVSAGAEVDFGDDARPVRIADFPDVEVRLRRERQEKIGRLRESLREWRAMQLLVPAYDLGSGRLLLLDGCHRVAALAGAPVPFAAAILTLHAPIDPRILPDLTHWKRASAP